MKQKFRDVDKDGRGSIGLLPEEPEDMWHLYNLIQEGDMVKSTTIRKIVNETSTGGSTSERVRVTLAIQVEDVHFDAPSGVLRLRGKVCSENKFVKMGAYHTLDLETNRDVTVYKNLWDIISLERVQNATDPTQYADVGAVVMQEGMAIICVVTSTMTIVRAKIEVAIPRKRRGSVTSHEKGLEKFFETVMQGILRHFNFEVLKCIIIASPGFVKDQFYEYMMLEAVRQGIKILLENKPKFVLAHSSTGHKHGLREVMSDPAVAAKLVNTKAAGEVKALNDFYDMLKQDPDRAFYGPTHVQKAHERLAIQTLLLTDELFRSSDIPTRKKYVKLVEDVKEAGGEVRIFSSMHVSGEQLGQLSGIAAILRFPLPDIEDEEEHEKDANENGKEEENS